MKNKFLLSPKNAVFFILISSFLFAVTSWGFNKIKKEKHLPIEHSEQSLSKRSDNKIKNENLLSSVPKDFIKPADISVVEPFAENNLFEGSIGSIDPINWYDEASDNIFDVKLNGVNRNKEYVLTYEVQGLDNAASVTRSINQSLSLGGYIQSKSDKWNMVKENIDPALLKNGVNHILFNANGKKSYYKIRDVKITENYIVSPEISKINSKIYNGNILYLKGYVNVGSNAKTLQILNETVNLQGSEFEYFGNNISSKSSTVNLVFRDHNGNIVENKTIKLESQEKPFNIVDYNIAEEKVIEKNAFGYLIGLRNIDLPPVDPSITNLGKGYYGYRFKNLTNNQNTIHIPYSKNSIPKGYSEKNIAAFKFDYNKKKWERVKYDSINVEKEYIIINDEGKGDSDYVNGVIKNPQSPETASFAPTTVNDIPVANPMAKVNMIAPPIANQQGSANLQYPIEIPAGINGMQPNVSIVYNSDSKTGWAGTGWDISAVETIDIDTRWGVPEFNDRKESEIYSIDGEQLVFNDSYLPNKIPQDQWINRSSDIPFYFRIGVKEGLKIIRKGSDTTNYTWEITGTDGSVKVYDNVIRDNSQNIVKWYLSTITDVNGNVMRYNYNDESSQSFNGLKNKYLRSILYSTNTEIEFKTQDAIRSDVVSSYKLGVKISEFKLLDKIIVKRAGLKIREYQLVYKNGDFEKQLLWKITQKDGADKVFNSHKFGYRTYNENLFSEVDKKEIRSSPNNDVSNNGFLQGTSSMLSGVRGNGFNFKGAATVGVGFGPSLFKNKTAGFNYTYSENSTFGNSQLMDFDGDGLPDKVFFNGNTIQYRKNIGNSFGPIISSSGLSNYPLSKSSSYVNSYGFEISFFVTGGITYSTTQGNSPIYFSDVNGDGLVDMVYYGQVFFNKIRLEGADNVEVANFAAVNANGSTTNPTSNPTALLDTPNAILKGVPAPKTEIPEQESNRLANIVRAWEAPFDGNVHINSYFRLDQNSKDGVETWIEKGNLNRNNEKNSGFSPSTEEGSKIILNNPGQEQSINISSTPVTKGQRIYIISSAKKNSIGDNLKMESLIEYLPISGFTSQMNAKDINGNDYFKFNSKNTFLKSTSIGNSVTEKGQAKISWSNLSGQTFSDDLNFKIYKVEKKATDDDFNMTEGSKIIFHQKIKRGQSISQLLPGNNLIGGVNIEDFSINTISTETDPIITFLYFEVTSDTNVSWENIDWSPKVSITTTDAVENHNMTVKYQPFSEVIKLNSINPNLPISSHVRYYPKFTTCYDQKLYLPSAYNGAEVTFSIKFKNYTLNGVNTPFYILKKKVKVENNLMEIPFIDYYGANPTYSQIAVEIHSNNYQLGKHLAGLDPFIETLENNCIVKLTSIRPNYYSIRSETKNYNETLGHMWQGWGGFVYNGTKYINESIKTIREGDFFIDPLPEEDYPMPQCDPNAPDYESCMLNYLDGQAVSRYFTSVALDSESNTYKSPLESANFGKDSIEPSNMFARLPSVTFEGDPQVVTDEPRGIIMRSKGSSLNIYGSLPGASINGGSSKDESSEIFQDINGDQYPDIVIKDKYYKTNLLGALTEGYTNLGDRTIKNKTQNFGYGVSLSVSINPEKQSNTQTHGASSVGELVSQMGSSFAATGMGAGYNYANSGSNNENIWLDINGDGLSDYISNNEVFINTGKGFTKEYDWNITGVFANETEVKSGGGGINLGKGSYVAGVGKSFSVSKNKVFFIDMTGDGLVDQLVNENGKYSLFVNTGHSISKTAIPMGDSGFTIKNNQNTSGANLYATFCFGFGIKICASLGGGIDSSTSKQTVDLRDFDGDGLPDLLSSDTDNLITFVPNQANQFNLLTYIQNPLGGGIRLDYKKTNPNSNTKIGSTYQMPYSKLVLTQYVVDDNPEPPCGGVFGPPCPKNIPNSELEKLLFEYENGVQDRRERAFLGFGKVKTIDRSGITNITEYETSYTVAQDFYVPYHDKYVRQYFYKKGLVRSNTIIDSIGRPRSVTNYTYRYFDQPSTTTYNLSEGQTEPVYKDIGRIIPLLYKTETTTAEYNGNALFSKTLISTIDQYNKYGNVLQYTDRGSDLGDTTDDVKIKIGYHPVTNQNVGGIPMEHIVTDNVNSILRRSTTLIDSKGHITRIRRNIGKVYAEYDFEYDSYGNLKKSIFPPDEQDKRMFYEYQYDPTYHTYITQTTDAYGYTSKTQYDTNYLFGLPKTTTDLNNVSSAYTYDSFGRMTEYKSPLDNDWTIKLYYDDASEPISSVAVTERKAPVINGVSPSINYFSSLKVDNMGRELTTKKLIGFGGHSLKHIYTYTDVPTKDKKGRPIKAYVNNLATEESGAIINTMKNFKPAAIQALNFYDFSTHYVTYNYDELDRLIKTTQVTVLPNAQSNKIVTQTVYGFGNDRNGNTRFTQKAITPMGKNTTTYVDEKGRTASVVQNGDNTDLWTDYAYDILGQLTRVVDQDQNITQYRYDALGRRISENHPDAGLSTYLYDGSNKLVAFDNPVLRAQDQKITYTYNYNQLTQINYPDHIVKYEYGQPGAANYGAGRLIKQTDHTGIQMFKYSKLGQVEEEKRFMMAPNENAKVFKTNYVYDIYNRINKITYPDTEEVYYNYNTFGKLNNIKSVIPATGSQSDIVSAISYDYNDQMTEIIAGNGTLTKYNRDPWGRLDQLMLATPSTQTTLGPILRNSSYTYDEDNNVKNITTTVPSHNNMIIGDISIASDKSFTYDGFNRLKSSLITATARSGKKYYQLDMKYNGVHGITGKNSRWKTYDDSRCQNPNKEGADMVYHYDNTDHPNAVSAITSTIGGRFTTPWDCGNSITIPSVDNNEYYTYDDNGNMTLVEEEVSTNPNTLPERAVKRQLFWDVQNHLNGVAQDNALQHYIYDAGGERSMKSEGIARNIFTDGNHMPPGRPFTSMEPYTYYPNGYTVVNGAQVSKHYYIGSNKIAARVSNLPSHGFAAEALPELNDLSGNLMLEVETMAREAGYPPVRWAYTTDPVLETEEICSNALLAAASMHSPRTACYKKIMAGYNNALLTGTVCSYWHNLQLDDCLINQPNDEELDYQTYWIHPDHLGSGSVITNQVGSTTNWYEYMPFGEMLMEQSSGDYNNVYKYNGKELDEATGLYYYGARYYDPNTSVWLSVDPLANILPNWNPYTYSFNNPIMYSDPTGLFPEAKGGPRHRTTCFDEDGGPGPRRSALPGYMRTAAIRIAAAGLNSVGGGTVKGNSVAEQFMNGLMTNYASKHNMSLGQMSAMQSEIGQFYTGLSLVKGWHDENYDKLYDNIINNKNASHEVIDQVTRGSITEAENNWGVLGISGTVAAMVAIEGGIPQSVGNGPKGFKTTGVDVLDAGQRISGRYPLDGGPKNGILYRFNNHQEVGSYAVYDSKGMITKRVDLSGPAHNGIATPHVLEYGRNSLPNGTVRVQTPRGDPRPARNYEIPKK